MNIKIKPSLLILPLNSLWCVFGSCCAVNRTGELLPEKMAIFDKSAVDEETTLGLCH